MSNEKENVRFSWENKIIKGFPELKWTGKRPYNSTEYFPAQLKEVYGEADSNGWLNKIFWGDNLQVMSHLLKDYRGKIKFIYIDPPFDSKADYKKKIQLRGVTAKTDSSIFEEKQYGDIWNNDEYLQFMYERLVIMRELLTDDGSIMVHCDYRRVAELRLIMNEVFGYDTENIFRNEIIWSYRTGGASKDMSLSRKHDTILFYAKNPCFKIKCLKERQYLEKPFMDSKVDSKGRFYVDTILRDVLDGVINIVVDEQSETIEQYNTRAVLNLSSERVDYPTQKPLGLLQLLIELATKPGDLVFDCFMGSGTTQHAALKTGRRFIGADINLGAIQTSTMRLLKEIETFDITCPYEKPGFEVYNVNNYDFFRNPIEAKKIIIDLLQIDTFGNGNSVFDGEKDGRMYKLMPLTRIATKSDLSNFIENLPYSTYEKRKNENPDEPVDHITIVCMGHEPDLLGAFKQETSKYNIDIEIFDVLLEKKELQLKREAEAKIVRKGNKLVIESFYPMNLMQKLSMQKETVKDWKQLVDSIFIDWNYDGNVFKPTLPDVPEDIKFMVQGEYSIPQKATKIRVKITDLLSESIEVDVE
jgi:DNA modification methylase